MAPAVRQTTADLADTLLAEAHQHNFFQLLERLHGLYGDDLETPWPAISARPRLRLSSDPRLAFPTADVLKAARLGIASQTESEPAEGAQRYSVCTTFFGLHGTDSPLPGYFLDQVAYEHAHNKGLRPAFFDYFNHCLLTRLHQIWRKYRYYVRFQNQATDRFSRYVFALIGLGDEQLRGSTALPWSRLLSFAGVIASRSRAPGTVAGIVAHCFDLQQVQIREFEPRPVALAPQQLVSLGCLNGRLGIDFTVGNRTRTRSSKFTLQISNLSEARLREFLPNGVNFERLRALIDFLLRDCLAYDLELRLRQEEVPPFCLSRSQGAHLGWTSFMDNPDTPRNAVVRIKVRS